MISKKWSKMLTCPAIDRICRVLLFLIFIDPAIGYFMQCDVIYRKILDNLKFCPTQNFIKINVCKLSSNLLITMT